MITSPTVNAQWRAVALRDARLWTTLAVALPDVADDGASVYLCSVKTALERTGDRPLDVLVDARCPDSNFPYAILSLLHAEVSDA
jgi:hypothetical protein